MWEMKLNMSSTRLDEKNVSGTKFCRTSGQCELTRTVNPKMSQLKIESASERESLMHLFITIEL